jgi:SAM-dependent methyltransferase
VVVLDYDAEAERYDASRGGEPRAVAAAEAVSRLLPPDARTVADIACGTGIVTRLLRRPGRDVLGFDRSPGMLKLAAGRLPHRVAVSDATRLPIRFGGVDAVVLVWLLHLLDDAAPVVAEAARVLRPGGVFVTTVDKDDAVVNADRDVGAILTPIRRALRPHATDRLEHLTDLAAEYGLRPIANTTFVGTGQGRSARQWRTALETGRISWAESAGPREIADVCAELAELPDQDTVRDPGYPLIALASLR